MPRFQETVVKLSKNAVPSEHSCCSQGMLLLFPGSSFCCFQKLLLLFPGNSLRCSQGTSSTVPREQLWLFPGNDFLSVIYGEQATPRRCHARKKWCPGKRSTFYCRLHCGSGVGRVSLCLGSDFCALWALVLVGAARRCLPQPALRRPRFCCSSAESPPFRRRNPQDCGNRACFTFSVRKWSENVTKNCPSWTKSGYSFWAKSGYSF